MFKHSLWLPVPSSSESLTLSGIHKVPTVHTAQGKVLSEPGETRSDIWVVKRDTSEGQWEETVRTRAPSQVGRHPGPLEQQSEGCWWPAQEHRVLPVPGPWLLRGQPHLPRGPQSTPHWRESPTSREMTRGGAGGRPSPYQGVCARVASRGREFPKSRVGRQIKSRFKLQQLLVWGLFLINSSLAHAESALSLPPGSSSPMHI